MLILRVETGLFPAVDFDLEAVVFPPAVVAAKSPLAPAEPPPFSNRSTFHQPPAFLPTTVPRRPLSRRRTRVPAAISATLLGVDSSCACSCSSGGGRVEAFISVQRVVNLPCGGATAAVNAPAFGKSICSRSYRNRGRYPSEDDERVQTGLHRCCCLCCLMPLLLLLTLMLPLLLLLM